MTRGQFDLLIQYIDARVSEAVHLARNGSVSTSESEMLLMRLEASGIVAGSGFHEE